MAQKQNQPTQHSEQCPNSSLRSLCGLIVRRLVHRGGAEDAEVAQRSVDAALHYTY